MTLLYVAVVWFCVAAPLGVLIGRYLSDDPEEEAEAREEEAADRAERRLRRHEHPGNGEVWPWR